MTRAHLWTVAAFSLLSTGIVLADGSGTESSAAVRSLAQAAATQPATAPGLAHAGGPAHAPPPIADAAPTPAPAPVPDAPATAPTPAPAKTPASRRPRRPAAEPAAKAKPSKVGHVFVIALTGTGVDATFADGSPAPYLAQTLRPDGLLLDNYVPLGSADLPNYLAFAGGQPPNADTDAECATYRDFPASATVDKRGVVHGDGCVYPNTVLSLGDQITSSGRSWRAYAADMDKGSDGQQTCRRPDLPGPDETLRGRPGDGYATRHNPFVYFHSLLDLGDCLANDVPLDALDKDLASARTTPNLAFVAPNLCDSATEQPCADGRPGGPAAADAFLRTWVPRIRKSAAYRKDGLILIAFLSAPAGADPNAAPPRTGALVLSRYAKPGGTDDTPYDAYGLLRSVEELFALEPLGKAAGAASFAKRDLADAFAP